MPHHPALDPHAILKALGVGAVHSLTPVNTGTATAVWRVEHDQVTSALRVFRPDQAPISLRELEAMALATRHHIPVPQVRGQGYWQDCPALLLAWCDGQPLATALQRQPWRLFRLGRAFGQMQAKIHRIPAPALADPSSADWLTWYGAVDPGLEAVLRSRCGHVRQLIHLDYHPLNVMVNRGHVSGVLDWANVRAGDPRGDVARTYAILVVEPHSAGPETLWYRAARRILARVWMAGYRNVAGPLQDMALFFAWAGAVMQADLAPRLHDPNSWWQPRHMGIVQHWTQHWRKRAEDLNPLPAGDGPR